MFISVWLLATLIYVALLTITIYHAGKTVSAYDFASPLIALFLIFLETIAYLIFWIIYLAV